MKLTRPRSSANFDFQNPKTLAAFARNDFYAPLTSLRRDVGSLDSN